MSEGTSSLQMNTPYGAVPPRVSPRIMMRPQASAYAPSAESGGKFRLLPLLIAIKQAMTAIKPSDPATPEDIRRVDLFRGSLQVHQARHQTLQKALAAIKTRWEQNGRRGAVVLDLDETILDNLDYYKRYHNYDQKAWDAFLADPAHTGYMPETVAFLQELNKLGIPVYFASARKDATLRKPTETLINRLAQQYKLTNIKGIVLKGDRNVDGLTYNNHDEQGNSVGKNPAYQGIIRREGEILGIIGDQETDAADARMLIPFFKLPAFYQTGTPKLWEPGDTLLNTTWEQQPAYQWTYMA